MTPSAIPAPDPRWQDLFPDQAALADYVNGWRVGVAVPDGIADVLRVARRLLIDSYFTYEYSLVAVVWSLHAAEASLRGCMPVGEGQQDKRTFGPLVDEAAGRRYGLITAEEADALRSAVELRNRVLHQGYLRPSQPPHSYPPSAAMDHLEAIHHAISDIYQRAGVLP